MKVRFPQMTLAAAIGLFSVCSANGQTASPADAAALQRMKDLGSKTKAGAYYDSVQVPEDLGAFYQAMLDYGNAGRRDPDFRKTNGATLAIDLSGSKTQMGLTGAMEVVFKQNPAPPYFAPHVLNDQLNKMAQFQAEYNASERSVSHDGPRNYFDKQSNKTVAMYDMMQRAVFFNVKDVVEAAGGGRLGDSPHNWMKSDTHFRPWFNVDGCYPEIGYGAARQAPPPPEPVRGGAVPVPVNEANLPWHFVSVIVRDSNCSKGSFISDATGKTDQTNTVAVGTQLVSGNGFPLRAGTKIVQGQKYFSESGGHYLIFQPDGNVVLYNAANQYQWGLQSLTQNYSQSKNVLVQPDGNFAVYGENNAYIWSALTSNPDPSAYLTMAPEGVLRLVSGNNGATLWASDKNLDPVYPLSGAAGSGSDKGQPGPTPQTSRPLTLNFNAQYAIRQPDGTFRYFQSVRNREKGNKFQACPQPSSSGEITLYSLDAVMRVEDALAQGFTASGQPCDVNQVPFGK